MRFLTRLTLLRKRTQLIMLPIICLMVVGCSSLANHSPTWPTNLTTIQLNDGGVCFDADSAVRLSEFKAELESY